MSDTGKIEPQLSVLLDAIAERIEKGHALKKDAKMLRVMARQAAGDDAVWTLKVHDRRRGPKAQGAGLVARKYEMACAIKEYREAHGCSLEIAYDALCSKFYASADTMKQAWKAMRAVLRLDEAARQSRLIAMSLEAEGFTIKRAETPGK